MFYYTSQNPTAPQINNQWGDLNRVLNYIVDGGKEYSIDRIEWYKKEYVKIYYSGSQIPVYNYETFTISGSGDYDNKKFVSTSSNEVEKYFIARNTSVPSVAFSDINNSGMTVKIVPCGVKRKFGGVDDKRTVFRFKDKFDIRIDDRNIGDLFTPKITWDENSAKFIRICGSTSFDTLDFTSQRQIPFNSEMPNLNFYPTNDYVSENIFIYNKHYNNNSNSNNNLSFTEYTNTLAKWRIWADENAIYIHLQGNTASYVCGFGLYDIYNQELSNGFIYSNGNKKVYDGEGYSSQYVNSRGNFGADYYSNHNDTYNNQVNHCLIYDDGTSNNSFYRQFSEFSLYPSMSGNSGLKLNNMNNNIIFHSPIVLGRDGKSEYFGRYYGLRWVNTSLSVPHDYVYIDNDDNKMYMGMKTYYNNEVNHDSVVFVELTYE